MFKMPLSALSLLSLCVLPSAFANPTKFADESAAKEKATDTIVSPSEAEVLFKAADAQFTREQVCEDYELGLHLLALVQSPQGRRGDNTTSQALAADLKNCPGTFSGVAKELRKRVTLTRDFHTNFDINSSGSAVSNSPEMDRLNGSALPIITACSDPVLCGGLVGAPLYPLRTDATIGTQGQGLYAFSMSATDSDVHFYNVEAIGGKTASVLMKELRESQLISKTRSGTSVDPIRFFLNRHILDFLDRDEKSYAMRDVRTGTRFTVQASYAPNPDPKLIAPANLSRNYQLNFRFSKSFGCLETEDGSTDNIGGCLTENGRLVVWISTFAPSFMDRDLIDLTKSLLAKYPKAAQAPVLLDVRNNGGGSPYLASDFACTFGDDKALREMKRRRLAPSLWPETFVLSNGKTITSASINKSGNDDLYKASPGWTVASNSPDAHRRDYTVGFFDRVNEPGKPPELNDSICVQQRDKRFTNTKWVVMMNGKEFSATENFLSFIEPSISKFKLVGADTTWGGTGAPMFITLPNTNMRLRLSLARHINGIDGSFPIESVGVPSTMKVLRDDSRAFERRLIDSADGLDILTTDYAPNIFRYAQSIRP